MQAWFVRSNGDTQHNYPGSKLFVPGEPPVYPQTAFDYRTVCLEKGFARLGMPGTGDLKKPDWRDCLRRVYGKSVHKGDERALEQFASIEVGDVVLIPAGRGRNMVHIGIAVSAPGGGLGGSAYYYHYDVAHGDWFENAHRVNVLWARQCDGSATLFKIQGIQYRQKLSRLVAANSSAIAEAKKAGLLEPANRIPLEPLDEDDAFPEGREVLVTHRMRERNPLVVRHKKVSVLEAQGRLACEACGFDFEVDYGVHGAGYIECHHTLPISKYADGQTTTVDDLVLVCANCHRVLHRVRPWMTLDDLRSHLKQIDLNR
jgi:predicted HNH restriction endonuclease